MANVFLGQGTYQETVIASAATCDIGTLTTYRVNITGTVTITSLGTGTWKWRKIRFTGILVLTYNAASLILPGNANITTAAGDYCEAVSDGSGNWTVTQYQRRASAP